MIPLVNLQAQHDPLRQDFLAVIDEVIRQSAFASGPYVAEFERAFAAYCDAPHAIGVGSGTEALWLVLLALGVRPGDEVITVPNTFIATAEAISHCGAKPVFVDIEGATHNLDPAGLERAITPRTKAIVPVHLFGQSADMSPILSIGQEHGVPVIEDAAQAHGAEYRGRKVGTLGIAGCFSFYPGKNLGALGEAGAVLTNSACLHEQILALRDHGQSRKYHHDFIGWNARMDGLQGAVLNIKLKHLERGNAARRAHAQRYDALLQGVDGIAVPVEACDRKHVYHLYVVRVKRRDQVLAALRNRNIQCGIHYPVPLHLQTAYRGLGYPPGSFPVAEHYASEILSLPMYPELTDAQIVTVSEELVRCVTRKDEHEFAA